MPNLTWDKRAKALRINVVGCQRIGQGLTRGINRFVGELKSPPMMADRVAGTTAGGWQPNPRTESTPPAESAAGQVNARTQAQGD